MESQRQPLTEDFELGQYVHALTSSSNRIRYLIFAVVITTIVVFVSFRHGSTDGWTMSRVGLMREALRADIWNKDGQLSKQKELAECAAEVQESAPRWPWMEKRSKQVRKISEAHGFKGLNCWQLDYVVSKLGLSDRGAVEDWLDKIEEAQVDGIVVMKIPFLGAPFDINDLGIFSGLTYTVLMVTLWFAMVRHQENLYLSMWKVRELAQKEDGQDPQGRANLLYHAMSMSQLFTTPPTLARWETGLTDWLPRLFFLMPVAMQWFIIRNDLKTFDRGSMVNESAAVEGWWIEAVTFGIIGLAGVICILYAQASDRLWTKTFHILNPGYRFKLQPSWLEWVRLRPKVQAPGWGIAVHVPDGKNERHVYVADFQDGKVWSFADPLIAAPVLVAEKRCRELGVDRNGTLYGEHIPYPPFSKKWEYSRWSLSNGIISDDLPPTKTPPRGQGVLRDAEGNRYSVDGRGPGKVQVLYKTSKSDGRVVLLAGGVRGVCDGHCEEAGFEWVQDITVLQDGTLFLTDGGCIRRVTPEMDVTTLGGNPLGEKSRYRRSRLLGIAVTDRDVYAADYDFRHVWKVPRTDGAAREVYHAGRHWSPAGLICADNDLYILEHRPDSLLGKVLSWIGPWSRVRKADLSRPDEKPVVLVTFGRRRKVHAKPVKPPAATPSSPPQVSATPGA
ncbi:MAG TPA: hypothetical protein VLE27_09275 [Thermoanaerobaculia bacterium]|nr:hypothetical protein [Thermoanaerobaculia bacterium]